MVKKLVGIVTFCGTLDNYGQVLQYWALQEYLKKEGYEPFLIKLNGGGSVSKAKLIISKDGFKIVFNSLVRRITMLFNRKARESVERIRRANAMAQLNEKMHPRGFEDFRTRNFDICEINDLRDAPYADIYMSGSDQIWANVNDYNFLNFGNKESKRVSLASSFGKDCVNSRFITSLSARLKDFDVVTVREESGVSICKSAGRKDCACVPDPTFLLDKDSYIDLAADSTSRSKEYVFVYLLGNLIDVEVSQIYAWAKVRDLEVVYVASQGRADDYHKCYASVEEWIKLIDGAKYIFTNSFHGAALSIIMNKQFVVFPLVGINKGANDRVYTMCQRYGLMNRIYDTSLDVVESPIDYENVNNLIKKHNQLSFSILNNL